MRVAVFTGSSPGPTTHRMGAAAFAETLARRGVGIVYGGGRVGLMGTIADAALAAGGEVVGVMPQHLVDREIAHRSLTRLDIVADMHERKARMAGLADAFIAMPGGAGTLEELFEAFTWGQLGLHEKPTALLDVDGFFAPLRQQLQVMCADGYIDHRFVDALGVVDSADAFLRFVGSYTHPSRKWSNPDPVETTSRLDSVGWLAIEGQRLLAVRTRGRHRFYLPGGKIEPGETNEAALRREVREELGIGLREIRPAFTIDADAHDLPGTRLAMHCFHAIADGAPHPRGEIEEIAWLGRDDTSRAAPAVKEVLARLTADNLI